MSFPPDEELRALFETPSRDRDRVIAAALAGPRQRARRLAIAPSAVVAAVVVAATALLLAFALGRGARRSESKTALPLPPAIRLTSTGSVVVSEESTTGRVALVGGDRKRDRFRAPGPRILILSGGGE